jgi:hypothetical protein
VMAEVGAEVGLARAAVAAVAVVAVAAEAAVEKVKGEGEKVAEAAGAPGAGRSRRSRCPACMVEARAAPGTRRQRSRNTVHYSTEDQLACRHHSFRHNRRRRCLADQASSCNSPMECRRTTSRCPRLPRQLHRSMPGRLFEKRGPTQRRSPRRCGCLRDRRRETGTLRAQPPTCRRLVRK